MSYLYDSQCPLTNYYSEKNRMSETSLAISYRIYDFLFTQTLIIAIIPSFDERIHAIVVEGLISECLSCDADDVEVDVCFVMDTEIKGSGHNFEIDHNIIS